MSPGGSWPGSAATRGPPVLSFYPYGLLLLLLCKHCSSSTTWISSFMIACPRQSMGREDKNKRSLREGRRPYRVGWNACIFGARWTVHFYLYFSPPGSPFLSSILCVFPDPHSMILCCLPYEVKFSCKTIPFLFGFQVFFFFLVSNFPCLDFLLCYITRGCQEGGFREFMEGSSPKTEEKILL